MVKTLAALLTILGVIVAVCAAAKLPEEGDRFPTTTTASLVAVLVGTVGIILWRIADRQAPLGEGTEQDESRNPLLLLAQLQQPMQQLCQDAPALDSQALRQRLDQIVDRYVLPFSAARNTVIHRLGIQRGAELLIEFALGERLLNRAWSAAADGHLPEAVASLQEARDAFAVLRAT